MIELAGPHINSTFKANEGYNLKITGHSLGAGTAELATMILLSGHEDIDLVPENTSIQCVALAPPPVFRCDSGIDQK